MYRFCLLLRNLNYFTDGAAFFASSPCSGFPQNLPWSEDRPLPLKDAINGRLSIVLYI